MIEKSPFIFKFAMVRQILIVEEDGFVLNEIDSLGPAHGIRIVMSWYLFILHVVDDIHVHFPCSHKVDHSASSGQIAPSVGVQLYPQSIFVVFWQELSQFLRVVVVVKGGHLADHDVLLVGCHVQVVDAHSPCHQVVDCEVVGEIGVHFFGLADEGEIQEAVLVGAYYVVVKVEVELVVHR